MRHKIVYDKKGRMRVRLGISLSYEQAAGLTTFLLNTEGVISAEVTAINGGMLIYYKAGFRDSILKRISDMKKRDIPEEADPSAEARALDADFKKKLFDLLIRAAVRKFLIPAPINALFTLKRAGGFISNGLTSLFDGKINVAVLDAVSISSAILSGSYSTANSIMMLLGISELLEEYTHKKAKATLAKSIYMNVDKVWLVTEQGDIQIPGAQLKKGDNIRVRAGSMIPVDGEVYEGEANVNESSMTGEPLPVLRSVGASVYAGTAIDEGSIVITVRNLPDESRMQKIADMIDESENLKASVQSKAEKLADAIVPYSLLTAIGTYIFTQNVQKALSVLMVDYSCAIKLSSPICVISAMREAVTHNLMIKGGKHLESYAKADTIVFDKTGTLTRTCPQVEKIYGFNGYSENEVLKISACIEEHFPHSIARAVVRKAEEMQLNHEEEHADVEYVVAHGIATILNGERTLIGSAHFLFEDEAIEIDDDIRKTIKDAEGGCSALYLSIGKKLVGMICINDPVRSEAAEVIEKLKENGFKKVIMITGDSDAAAKNACEKLGIDEYYAQVLPENKAELVAKLKENGHTVVMVGDGINDSPALAAADVSVAMRSASDIAREVADITLLSEDLMSLITLRELSDKLFERISENHRFIVGFNTLLIIGGITGVLTPSASALLHNVSTTCISGLSTRPCLIR
ncbi:MAG: heavy metal translocating P-type ATPase [Firmicutes bacterium]|nr:heavy metal translocating P-type ATPase [Bacillota bacterium]